MTDSDAEVARTFFELKRGMVEIANARKLTGDMAEIWEIVDGHDIVCAVWQDCQESDGVGMQVVKGKTELVKPLA